MFYFSKALTPAMSLVLSLFAPSRTGLFLFCIETGRYHLTKESKSNVSRKLSVEERTCLEPVNGSICKIIK